MRMCPPPPPPPQPHHSIASRALHPSRSAVSGAGQPPTSTARRAHRTSSVRRRRRPRSLGGCARAALHRRRACWPTSHPACCTLQYQTPTSTPLSSDLYPARRPVVPPGARVQRPRPPLPTIAGGRLRQPRSPLSAIAGGHRGAAAPRTRPGTHPAAPGWTRWRCTRQYYLYYPVHVPCTLGPWRSLRSPTS